MPNVSPNALSVNIDGARARVQELALEVNARASARAVPRREARCFRELAVVLASVLAERPDLELDALVGLVWTGEAALERLEALVAGGAR